MWVFFRILSQIILRFLRPKAIENLEHEVSPSQNSAGLIDMTWILQRTLERWERT